MLLSERVREFNAVFSGKFIISQEFEEWLCKSGFFTAPASTIHHGNYEGGLFDHSLQVTKKLLWLTESLGLKWELLRSPCIVGMFHDLCKINAYEMDPAGYFVHADKDVLPGHGEKSIILLQRFVTLTDEEIACIRWHMGAFDDKDNWSYYSKTCGKFPNVLYTHTADMIASQIDGV